MQSRYLNYTCPSQQATLGVVRRERDVAVARLKALMAEMAELKLVYRSGEV